MPSESVSQAETTRSIAAIEHEMDVLVRNGRRATRRRAAQVAPTLQPIGFSVLVVLVRDGQQYQNDIADAVGIDKSAASKVIAHLVQLGLVTRSRADQDRRLRLIDPTPVAVERVERALSGRRAHLEARFARWEPEDLHELQRLLSRYNVSDPDDPITP